MSFIDKLTGSRLPCYVLSRSPFIFFAYDSDFISSAAKIVAALPRDREIFLFLQLGWQHQTPRVAEPFARELHRIAQTLPALRITVLGNSPAEVDTLTALGIKCVYCHQNAFLDEREYPLKNVAKKFDAIYIARITPFKRHDLARDIPSLRLIGGYSPRELNYAQGILELLKPHSCYSTKVHSFRVSAEVAAAHCGLCLSAEEGAMFVSAEYLLSGIPVVNTASIGGRELVMPDFAVKQVEDSAGQVAQAVSEWVHDAPAPEEIRRATIEMFKPHRAVLRKLIGECFQRGSESLDSAGLFTGTLPHKLGLRCRLMPWSILAHRLRAIAPRH